MSKYIRTKDNIYEIDFSRNETDICYFTKKGWVYKEDIICQSDNLENLLDAFLCENKLGHGTCSRDFEELKRDAISASWKLTSPFASHPRTMEEVKFSFYGLIKRNQDLICVAKYNDETKEWELI